MLYAVIFQAKCDFKGMKESGNPYQLSAEFPFLCQDKIETLEEAEGYKSCLDTLEYVQESIIIQYP